MRYAASASGGRATRTGDKAGAVEGRDEHARLEWADKRDRLIAVVDPDPVVCEELSLLFRIEGFRTTFYFRLDAFEAELKEKKPAVAVVALAALDEHTGAVARRLKAAQRGMHLFFLSEDGQLGPAVEAMRDGASGVVAKPVDKEALLESIKQDLTRSTQVRWDASGRQEVEILGFPTLTEREHDVLECLVDGLSSKESALQLRISPRTVEVHRASIMHKLGARNTAELMRIVFTS
jgi:two-component system, LuxR family, response regulator FixJ